MPSSLGGSIRDAFLQREAASFDLDIVSFKPSAILKAAREGKKHYIVELGGKKPKTAWRIIDKNDKSKHIDLCAIEGASIAEDLAKRHFTSNALGWEITPNAKLAHLHDPQRGKDDIASKIIKLVSKDAFRNDPLRILRGFRFKGELNFNIEKETAKSMQKNAFLLDLVSGERIRDEFFTILSLQKSAPLIRQMDNFGILEQLFYEIDQMRSCQQDRYHCIDVWSHTLLVYDVCEELINNNALLGEKSSDSFLNNFLREKRNSSLLKLSALLHDIAKPATKGVHPKKGHITFHGHDHAGAKRSIEVARRLHLSKEEQELLFHLIKEHLHVHALLKPETTKKKRISWLRAYREHALLMLLLEIADSIGANREFLPQPPPRPYKQERAISLMKEYILHYRKEFSFAPFLNGNDLIALGFKPGKKMGKALQILEDAQYTGEFTTKAEAIQRAKALLTEG